MPPLLPWTGLLAVLLLRSNRCRKARAALVPLVVVLLVWLIVRQVLPDEFAEVIGQLVGPLALTLTVLWLLSHKLSGRRLIVAASAALPLMVLMAATAHVCANGWSLKSEPLMLLVLSGVGALVLGAGLIGAALCCRRAYTPRAFMLWLLLWTMIASIASIAAVILIVEAWVYGVSIDLEDILLPVGISGLILTAIVYLTALPFMILTFRNPLYRDRFRAFLPITSAEPPPEPTGFPTLPTS